MSELFPGIKQISQTGNDMYIQGAFPVGIGNTDVGYLADPADTMLLAGRDPVIHEVSVGISGEEAALYDVSGTPPLSLPNSLGKPLKAWAVNLSPYQEGTGDPAPDNVRPIHGTDKLNLFVEESYDPTATPKAVITLPSTIYSGSVYDGGAVSAWGEVDLGTLTWVASDNASYFIARDLPGYAATWWGIDNLPAVMCKQYKPAKWNDIHKNITDFAISAYANQVRCSDSRFTDADVFKAAVSGVKLLYELSTPTSLTLSTPSIPTPRGNATTWATAEDGTVDGMEVTYVGKA